MEASERDSTQDWLLPEGSAPPLLSELEIRIDEAVATARASERAVMEVGDVAIDAAKQARRAAELAERASASALEASRGAVSVEPSQDVPPVPSQDIPSVIPSAQTGPAMDGGLRGFSERADRLVARLRALERRPHRASPSSVAAGRRRPGG
jgi:hypothetical protein